MQVSKPIVYVVINYNKILLNTPSSWVSFVKLPEVFTVTMFLWNRLVLSDLPTLSTSPACSMLESRNVQKTRHTGNSNVSTGGKVSLASQLSSNVNFLEIHISRSKAQKNRRKVLMKLNHAFRKFSFCSQITGWATSWSSRYNSCVSCDDTVGPSWVMKGISVGALFLRLVAYITKQLNG